MSSELARRLVKVRLEQAVQTLEDAEYLLQGGKSGRSVVNRAYYAAFYALLGLVQTIGRKPKKHQEAVALFDREFVKPGIIDKRHSKDLHWLFDRRMADDYTSLSTIGEEERRNALHKANEFVARAREYLKEKGFLD